MTLWFIDDFFKFFLGTRGKKVHYVVIERVLLSRRVILSASGQNFYESFRNGLGAGN